MPQDLPAVGTDAYRQLSFHKQLEITSLRLFSPEEYARRVGETTVASPSDGLPDLGLAYPKNNPDIEDFPVAYLHKYWAGYNCKYREEWYLEQSGSRGVTPLDTYDLDVGYLVNVRTFNFSLLGLTPALQTIFVWVRRLFHDHDEPTDSALLDACKIYTFMVHAQPEEIPMARNRKKELVPDPMELFFVAMAKYATFVTFDELNGYYPMIEPCEESDYLEWGEFVLVQTSRKRDNRWFYPVVPSSMFSTTKFSIKGWDFIDPKLTE